MQSSAIPRLVSPRTVETLEAVRNITGGHFDADAYHVIAARDDRLIQDEILNGAASAAFVYQFKIGQTDVAGVSVIGARHLAAHYGGLKHRFVASTQKIGALHTFYSFPTEGVPMSVTCSVVQELEPEPDYYSCVIEITDVKTGNTIQVEHMEKRFEERRDGTEYERPHYQKIAQSKAYRTGVLDLLPQDVQAQFLQLMLKQGKGSNITQSVIGEKRASVLRFASSHAVGVDRRAIEHLSADQIAGLGDAAREGVPAFTNAARSLGIMIGQEPAAALAEPPKKRGRPPKLAQAPQSEMPIHAPSDAPAEHDPDTGEIREREPGEEG